MKKFVRINVSLDVQTESQKSDKSWAILCLRAPWRIDVGRVYQSNELIKVRTIKFIKHLQSQDLDKLSNLAYESERQAFNTDQVLSGSNIGKFLVEIYIQLDNSDHLPT